jgi:hypothetical protein
MLTMTLSTPATCKIAVLSLLILNAGFTGSLSWYVICYKEVIRKRGLFWLTVMVQS